MREQTFFQPSPKLVDAIKHSGQSRIDLAKKAGVKPSTFYQLLCGAMTVKPSDPRLIAIGKLLGLQAEDCVETSN